MRGAWRWICQVAGPCSVEVASVAFDARAGLAKKQIARLPNEVRDGSQQEQSDWLRRGAFFVGRRPKGSIALTGCGPSIYGERRNSILL